MFRLSVPSCNLETARCFGSPLPVARDSAVFRLSVPGSLDVSHVRFRAETSPRLPPAMAVRKQLKELHEKSSKQSILHV